MPALTHACGSQCTLRRNLGTATVSEQSSPGAKSCAEWELPVFPEGLLAWAGLLGESHGHRSDVTDMAG